MKHGIRAIGFLAGYYLAMRFNELAEFRSLGIVAICLPAGVSVAAFMAFEWWALPLVFFASLISGSPVFVDSAVDVTLMHAMVSAFGETAQSAIIWRLWRSDLPEGLVTVGDVLRLIILACFVPVAINALETAFRLLLGDGLVWGRLPFDTMSGGLADGLGVLVIVPAYWAWQVLPPMARFEGSWISFYLLLIAFILYGAFHRHPSFIYLSVPVLFGLSMQVGLRGEILGQGLLFLGLTAATAQGVGPFEGNDAFRAYMDLLIFMGSMGFAAMGVAVSHTRLLGDNAALEAAISHEKEVLEKEVAEREWLQQQVMHRAHCDELTGLPNRAMFFDRLEQSIIHARRRGTRFALFFIDLDGFKDVNDTWGHEAGDFLLRQVGERLRGCVRESDTIARMGGDEFTVIVNDISFRRSAAIVADKVLTSLSRPFQLPEGVSHIGASIGITLYPDDGEDAEELLNLADAAMYVVKRQGKNHRRFYGDGDDAEPESVAGDAR